MVWFLTNEWGGNLTTDLVHRRIEKGWLFNSLKSGLWPAGFSLVIAVFSALIAIAMTTAIGVKTKAATVFRLASYSSLVQLFGAIAGIIALLIALDPVRIESSQLLPLTWEALFPEDTDFLRRIFTLSQGPLTVGSIAAMAFGLQKVALCGWPKAITAATVAFCIPQVALWTIAGMPKLWW